MPNNSLQIPLPADLLRKIYPGRHWRYWRTLPSLIKFFMLKHGLDEQKNLLSTGNL